MGTPLTVREILVGVKKAAAWGTPVAVGANEGILALDLTLPQRIEHLPDESMGQGFLANTELGRETVEGSLRQWLRYDGQEWVLAALAMGQAGVPTQQAATLAYLHTLQLTDEIVGKFATFARKTKSDEVFEWPSMKITGFTIRGGMRIPTEITFDLIGTTLTRNAGSGTNNTTTIASVTYRDKQNRMVTDENAYVRINDQSAAALAAADNVYAAEFTLTFRRPQAGEHVIDQTAYIDEPLGTGFPEVTLALTFPQYRDVNKTFWDNFTAKTAKKIEIFLKGAVADSTENFRALLQIPQAYAVQIDADTSGSGKIPSPLLCRLYEAATAPAGMTGITKPFAIKVVNKRTTDLLA